jgi:hypothetical protein
VIPGRGTFNTNDRVTVSLGGAPGFQALICRVTLWVIGMEAPEATTGSACVGVTPDVV